MKNNAKLITNYEEVNLTSDIKLFEDGFRTNGKNGEYEWWYFDSKLNDGSSLVIIFFINKITTYGTGFAPYVSFDLKRSDGSYIASNCYPIDNKDYFFSKEKCDVRIGKSYIKGDLSNYEIHFEENNIVADVKLKGRIPSWRPYSGMIKHGKHYFAWLPSVPEGSVKANIIINNETLSLSGTGYHDHNWGDTPMFFLMHHWYWGRAKIGDYVVVSSYITANKKYGYVETPIFMIARDGKIIADQGDKYLTYNESDYEFDPVTKKHFAKTLVYEYNDNNTRYVIKYKKNEDIEKKGMKDLAKGLQYILIKLIGLDGSYHRAGGVVTLEKYVDNELVEKITSQAIWEQMYFGKDKLR